MCKIKYYTNYIIYTEHVKTLSKDFPLTLSQF